MTLENKIPIELCNIVYQYSKDRDTDKYSKTGLIFKKFMKSIISDFNQRYDLNLENDEPETIRDVFFELCIIDYKISIKDFDAVTSFVRQSSMDFQLMYFVVYNYNYHNRKSGSAPYALSGGLGDDNPPLVE